MIQFNPIQSYYSPPGPLSLRWHGIDRSNQCPYVAYTIEKSLLKMTLRNVCWGNSSPTT